MDLSKKLQTITPSATLQITAKAKALKAEGKNVISFGAGEPDFDTPDFIKDAAKKALDLGLTKYTDAAGTVELRKAICDRFKKEYGLDYSIDQIITSNGAKHSLTNVFQAILNPGDEVIIPSPYWVSYPVMVSMADGVPVFVEASEDEEFKIDAEKLKKAITPKTKAIIINSPSNPCGSVYSKDELASIAKVCKENEIFIVSDEIYDELTYEGSHVSIANCDKDTKDITILVNGLSKSYAMTGWRMGYIACDVKIAKIIKAYQSHTTSNPNTMAQYASTVALNAPKDGLLEMKAEFDKRRKALHKMINDTEYYSCHLPKGAFYAMVNVSKVFGKKYNGEVINGSMDFAKFLLEDSLVAVVPGSAFGTDDHVRLSYASSIENITEGVKRMDEFSKKLV